MSAVHRRRAVAVAVLAALGGALIYAVASPGGGGRPSAVAATTTRPVPPGQVRIAYAGDIAMIAGPDGGASYFRSVPGYLRGDVVLGNLEGTLTARGTSKCKPGSTTCYAFRAPPSYARLLKHAGFTIMNNANNHAFDYGPDGEQDTIDALYAAGLRHTGRPGEAAIIQVGQTKVAVLGFAPYPWAQSLTNIPAAQSLVRRAAAYADLVVVTIHAGAEGSKHTHVPYGTEHFLGENRGNSRAFTHAVIDAGADLVVGSGPHVLRGMEWYRGRLIAYSLGNFMGCRTLSTTGVKDFSAVLHVTLLADGTWVRGDLAPIHLVDCGIPRHDPAESAFGIVRTLSRQDFGRRGLRIGPTGTLVPPSS